MTKPKMTREQIEHLASRIRSRFYSVLYEGDYSIHDGPSEDSLYNIALGVLTENIDEKRR